MWNIYWRMEGNFTKTLNNTFNYLGVKSGLSIIFGRFTLNPNLWVLSVIPVCLLHVKGMSLTVLLWWYPRNCCPPGVRPSSAAALDQEVPGPAGRGSHRAWNRQIRVLRDRGCGSGHRRVHGNCHPCDRGSGTVKCYNMGYFLTDFKVNAKCDWFWSLTNLICFLKLHTSTDRKHGHITTIHISSNSSYSNWEQVHAKADYVTSTWQVPTTKQNKTNFSIFLTGLGSSKLL